MFNHRRKAQLKHVAQIRRLQATQALAEALDSQKQSQLREAERDEYLATLENVQLEWEAFLNGVSFQPEYRRHHFEHIQRESSNLNISEHLLEDAKDHSKMDRRQWELSQARLLASEHLCKIINRKVLRLKIDRPQAQLEDRVSYMWGRI